MAVTLEPTGASAWALWQLVKENRPLIQCITNFVSMDIMANTLLAAGASPAMAHSKEEVKDFLKIASGLLVNVGTLSPDWTDSMLIAAGTANKMSKPWVLDPVGAGATPYRTQMIMSLVKLKPTVLRGNASEILAVAGAAGNVKGVDSTAGSDEALEAGKNLAREFGIIVAISGAEDLVTDGTRLVRVANGTALMPMITATGCSVTALATAFITQAPHDPLLATAHALAIFGLAAEVAQKGGHVRGPASLRTGLLDNLWSMTEDDVVDGVRETSQS